MADECDIQDGDDSQSLCASFQPSELNEDAGNDAGINEESRSISLYKPTDR